MGIIESIFGSSEKIVGNEYSIAPAGIGLYYRYTACGFTPKSVGIQNVLIHTEYSQSGDTRLWGFSTQEDRDLFRMLISVPGVGCNTARLLLGTDVVSSIERGDEKSIMEVKGIGAKTAKQLIVSLRGKFGSNDDRYAEVKSALVRIGHKANDIKNAWDKCEKNGKTTEDIIKELIKSI